MTSPIAPKAVYLKDYEPPAFRVEKVDISFDIQADFTTVKSVCRYVANDDARELKLNGEAMELLSVVLNGKSLEPSFFHLDNHFLILTDVPREFTLEITTCFDPAKHTALEGLYKSGDTLCTQCEAEGFRRITYFIDRPDVMAPYTTRIEADKSTYPVLLSNGNPVEAGDLPDGRHYTVWSDPFPKPCYLFAVVAGNLDYAQDFFVTMSGRTVDLRIYIRPEDAYQCKHAMESLKRAMKWDEDAYGREYHLERFNIVAISDLNMAGMENTSLNVFNSAYIMADPKFSTDLDFFHVEAVIAHEYFHNWTGNRVTCRDWFQLSLKEGLTVFREHEFCADTYSRSAQCIDDAQFLRSMQFPEDSGPLAHPVRPDHYFEIDNFYTTTIYEKGGEVVRMQATLLGPETYRKATDLYFSRHDGEAVTVDDFVSCMEEASGLDLTQFKLWYSQAGTPEVTATTLYDVAAQRFTLTLSQHIPDTSGQTDKRPMYIPVAVGLLNKYGEEIVPTQILHLKDKTENFVFKNIASRPVPSILRNFSAPVRLATDLSEEDLRLLMVYDTNGFARWDASQILTLRLINRMIDATEAGHMAVTDHAWLESVRALLEQALEGRQDAALLARMLTLPDFSIISQERAVIDPDHIHLVREKIKNDVLDHFAPLLGELYARLNVQKPYSPDPLSMAERTLKAVALSYLTCRGNRDGATIAKSLYDASTNMTDRMMGLSILANVNAPERGEALADFYARYKDHELVINKWFRVQAGAIRPQTIDDIRHLWAHPDFTITNPNSVRALFGTLALRNPVIFHKADGSGYDVFGEFISQLDSINPATAARLLTAFETWKRYDQTRQVKIRTILENILEIKNLSSNSYEITSKMLGA
ncbi:MAG TPA: aminopeptidase N [Alphaproteobacteria bacterium]|nr:aminopeptidase N [Alphaproteobacteria bacterium]HNS45146.1 aminopeptidase N [Alphaproteobacteria bacterium]